MQYIYWDFFSAAQNSFWTERFWCLSVLLMFFISPLPHWQKVSLWGLFLSRETTTKKCHLGQVLVNRKGAAWGSSVFGQKLLNTQRCGVGGGAYKSPIMKWASALKVFKRNSLKPNAASHNNASWYTDTDGFLEHSPSGRSLYHKGHVPQKLIPGFWGPPNIY